MGRPIEIIKHGNMCSAIVNCRICKKEHAIKNERMTLADFNHWRCGGLIQNTMPYLSSDDRELLISQTCPSCWEEMFSPKE